MMKNKNEKRARRDELRQEYDLSKWKGGVRGKFAARYRAGTFSYPGNANLRLASRARTNLALLSPDVAAYFPGEQSVNSALRTLIHAAKSPLPRAACPRLTNKKKQTQKPHPSRSQTPK